MSEKPRTWTLEKPPGIFDAVAVLKPREMRVGQKIEVIELEPVLDLLERLSMDVGMQESFQKCWTDGTLERTRALLREHGRKTEDWELDEE